MAEPRPNAIRNRTKPKTVSDVLSDLDQLIKSGSARELVPIPTHFRPLDTVLGGGVRAGDLTLVGGTPGVGKTVLTLQWARNIALAGWPVVYVCYEHEEPALLARLLALELGELPHAADDYEMEKLRAGIQDAAVRGGRTLQDVIDSEKLVARAYEQVQAYADRLWLVRGSGAFTGVPELEELIADRKGDKTVVAFIDYLQKVSVRPEPADEVEKVTRITEALKDAALSHKASIVAIFAADREGLKTRRLRLHHLRGSSAIAYEADVAIVLNEKFNCVSKVHLAYDPVRADSFKHWSVFTIEKNRGGPNLIDLEFQKDFVYYRFNPVGNIVAERLIDERLDEV